MGSHRLPTHRRGAHREFFSWSLHFLKTEFWLYGNYSCRSSNGLRIYQKYFIPWSSYIWRNSFVALFFSDQDMFLIRNWLIFVLQVSLNYSKSIFHSAVCMHKENSRSSIIRYRIHSSGFICNGRGSFHSQDLLFKRAVRQ